MIPTRTTPRAGTYDDVHAQVEQLARSLEPHEYLPGTWLRELAIALALHDGLVVSVVTYDRGGQELEVCLADANQLMLNSGDWTAIGTGALAAGTFVLAWVTVKTGAADRRHDDEKRAEDRARDDRLRQEALDQLERRERAEHTAREDYEARQVLVTVEEKEHPGLGHDFNRRVTLSTPHAYPIKWVERAPRQPDQ